jgi:hypothetical protein
LKVFSGVSEFKTLCLFLDLGLGVEALPRGSLARFGSPLWSRKPPLVSSSASSGRIKQIIRKCVLKFKIQIVFKKIIIYQVGSHWLCNLEMRMERSNIDFDLQLMLMELQILNDGDNR